MSATGNGPSNLNAPGEAGGSDAVDRLAASDPARGNEPDLAHLAAKVAQQTGVTLTGDAAVSVPVPVSLADARRRRWLMPVAAVAASALVFGIGGFALGRWAPTETFEARPAPGGRADDTGRPDIAPELPPEAALGGPGESVTGDSAYVSGGPRRLFQAAGLSNTAQRGEAWAFDPGAVDVPALLGKAATLFSVTGSVEEGGAGWLLRAGDESGQRILKLEGNAQRALYFNVYQQCAGATPSSPHGGDSGFDAQPPHGGDSGFDAQPPHAGAPDIAEEPPVPCGQPGPRDALDSAEAISKTRGLLADLGINTEALKITDGGASPSGLRTIYARPPIDGAPAVAQWRVLFFGDEIQAFSGPMAPLVSLGQYQLVSPQVAVARLNDPKFGATWAAPVPPADPLALSEPQVDAPTGVAGDTGAAEPAIAINPDGPASSTATSAPRPAATTIAPGAKVPWQVQQIAIATARLQLETHQTTSGATMLVPVYYLSAADGSTWSVLAVADQHLAISAD